jgi:hypothetical protein
MLGLTEKARQLLSGRLRPLGPPLPPSPKARPSPKVRLVVKSEHTGPYAAALGFHRSRLILEPTDLDRQ